MIQEVNSQVNKLHNEKANIAKRQDNDRSGDTSEWLKKEYLVIQDLFFVKDQLHPLKSYVWGVSDPLKNTMIHNFEKF